MYIVVIPIIETIFKFVVVYEGLAQRWKIPLNLDLFNIRQFALINLLSLIFVALHFAVRGLTNVHGLIITYIFGMVSGYLVLYTRQARESVLMHGFNNMLARGIIPGL